VWTHRRVFRVFTLCCSSLFEGLACQCFRNGISNLHSALTVCKEEKNDVFRCIYHGHRSCGYVMYLRDL
jgi:hypothetical protein